MNKNLLRLFIGTPLVIVTSVGIVTRINKIQEKQLEKSLVSDKEFKKNVKTFQENRNLRNDTFNFNDTLPKINVSVILPKRDGVYVDIPADTIKYKYKFESDSIEVQAKKLLKQFERY